MRSMLTLLPLLGILLGCQTTETRTNVINSVDAIRKDICTRAWKGVTTSRHDVLTEQTELEIAEDTAARAAYCG